MFKFLFLIIGAAFLMSAKNCNQDEKQKNWLVIGDSHTVQGFGDGLREELFSNQSVRDENYYQFSVSASRASHWLDQSLLELKINGAYKLPGEKKVVYPGKAPASFLPLPQLLEKIDPGTVIIALGTNDSTYHSELLRDNRKPESAKESPEKILKRVLEPVDKLLSLVKDRECIWILPPQLGANHISLDEHARFVTKLSETVSSYGCQVVDSRLVREKGDPENCWMSSLQEAPSVFPDQGDGVHFKRPKGLYWGQCLGRLISKMVTSENKR